MRSTRSVTGTIRSKLTLIVQLVFVWMCSLALLHAGPIQYSYDSLNRITAVVYPDGTTITYSYDAAGNRLSRIVSNRNNAVPFTLADRGGVSLTTQGTSAATQVAYAS